MREINGYILHFFPYEKFTESYVKFIYEYFNNDKHIFLLFGDEKLYVGDLNEILRFEHIYKINSIKIKQIVNLILKSHKIILHGLFNFKLYLLINIFGSNKCGVLFWGGDIEGLKSNTENLKRFIKKILLKFFFKKNICINLIENDYFVLTKELGYNFKQHYITSYYTDQYKNQVVKLPKRIPNKEINILLGNSATTTNNHFEIIDALSRFSDKNIKVYIPLSYGDMKYGDEVETYAKLALGDKTTALRNFMNPEDYNNFLNNMDIAIFNYNRQQGLGNINRLLMLRKKVYINFNSGLLSHYKKMGIKVYDSKSLREIEYNDFVLINDEIVENNRNKIIENMSYKRIIKLWKVVFESDW